MKAYLIPVAVGSALALSTALAAISVNVTFNGNTAPSGAHLANGSPTPDCDVLSNQSVSCNAYQIGGVGGIDADLVLSATYEGTVQCRNHGGKIVDVKTQTTTEASGDDFTEVRNGQLLVSEASAAAPSMDSFVDTATCPNGNWTKVPLGSPTLLSFTYTLTFHGYEPNSVVVITGP